MKKQLKNAAYTLLGGAIVIAVWQIAALLYAKQSILPTPAAALNAMGAELRSALFWRGFCGSLLRSVLAFAASFLLAAACAFAGKACAPVARMLSPVVGCLRSVPTMSVILLLVLWAGEDRTPLWVTGLVLFPVLYSGMTAALGAVPVELEESARLYGGGVPYRFFRVYLPLGAPVFLRVAGGAASMSLKLTVAAEVLAQTPKSIGLLMQQSRLYFQIERLLALTVAVVVVSLLMELLIYAVRKAVEY